MEKTVRRVTVNLTGDSERDLDIIRQNFHDSSDGAAMRRSLMFHAGFLKLPYKQRFQIDEQIRRIVCGGV
jgi:hypothetical protein